MENVEELITDPEDEDKVPCWAEIWPAARGLSQWIWGSLGFNGKELLELGSGLGLPGVVCGLKGARVTFSDFNPMALELSGLNAARNGLTDFATFLGDWRNFKINKQYDWVLGSDIFYDPKLNVYLKSVVANVTSRGGSLIMAHPGRSATFAFVESLRAEGGVELNKDVIPVTIDDRHFPYYEIHIHQIKLL